MILQDKNKGANRAKKKFQKTSICPFQALEVIIALCFFVHFFLNFRALRIMKIMIMKIMILIMIMIIKIMILLCHPAQEVQVPLNLNPILRNLLSSMAEWLKF